MLVVTSAIPSPLPVKESTVIRTFVRFYRALMPRQVSAAERIIASIRANVATLSDDELRSIECEASYAYMDRHPPVDVDPAYEAAIADGAIEFVGPYATPRAVPSW